MLVTIWSVKGGSGVSVVAAGLATVFAEGSVVPDGRSRDRGALLVDLGSDQPALLGLANPDGPGVLDWLASDRADDDALRRLEVEVSPSLSLLPTGAPVGAAEAERAQSWTRERELVLAGLLADDGRPVVVDGSLGLHPARTLADAGLSLLVVRPCYLALRRAIREGVRADGVVLVEEAGRALDAVDVSRALGLPVLSTVQVEAPVARAVDAGLLASRLPRRFARSLESLA